MHLILTAPRSLARHPGVNEFVLRHVLPPVARRQLHSLFICSDPAKGFLGSGAGTLHALREFERRHRADARACTSPPFAGDAAHTKPRVIVHGGGQSRRLPSYAPWAKYLMPLPRLRGACGQSVRESLLAAQLPLLAEAMKAAPPHLRTLVACGDVYLHTTRPLGEALVRCDGADVVCFGVHGTLPEMTRHGVFCMCARDSEVLECMLQKPALEEVQRRLREQPCLIDTGLWLLSARALDGLCGLCTQQGGRGDNDDGEDDRSALVCCDLYADFGRHLGARSGSPLRALRELSVRVVPLPEASFLHYGSSRDLIASTTALQQVVRHPRGAARDPPALCSDEDHPPEPSVFLCDAHVPPALRSVHHGRRIWVDNSFIGGGWGLQGEHVLTGVPPNRWKLSLAPGVCVDVAPTTAEALSTRRGLSERTAPATQQGGLYVARPYGMTDSFANGRTGRCALDAQFLGAPLRAWCRARGLSGAALSSSAASAHDLQHAQLFPCTGCVRELGLLLEWMVAPSDSLERLATADLRVRRRYDEARALWCQLPRLSAAELSECACLPALWRQRLQRRRENLLRITAPSSSPDQLQLFYESDLDDAAELFVRLRLPLPSAPAVTAAATTSEAMQRSRYFMFCASVLRWVQRLYTKGELDASSLQIYAKGGDPAALAARARAMETSAFNQLRDTITAPIAAQKQRPRRAVAVDEAVWAASPARIDVCGGWTDTPPYCIFAGGDVINVAVELDGRLPVRAGVRLGTRAGCITVASASSGAEVHLTSFGALRDHGAVGSTAAVPKAALALAGFVPEYCGAAYGSLQEQLHDCCGDGYGLEITLDTDIPVGSGLGSSSIMAAAVLQALSIFFGLSWSATDIGQRVLVLEQLVTSCGGWQDQYGGLIAGVKRLRSSRGDVRQAPLVQPLPPQLFTAAHHHRCHLLLYTGITRTAKTIVTEVVRATLLNDSHCLRVLRDVALLVEAMHESIEQANLPLYGGLLKRAWDLNRQLDANVCPPAVQAIIDRIAGFTHGYKMAGAGGGGYLYMVAKSEADAAMIRRELSHDLPSAEARFVEMRVATTGMQTWRSRSRLRPPEHNA